MLYVRDVRTMVFDKAPIVPLAAERATHLHVASPEYDEIARLCA